MDLTILLVVLMVVVGLAAAIYAQGRSSDGVLSDRYEKGNICTRCQTEDRAIRRRKGTDAVELALWILVIVPGIIYSVWRRSGRTSWLECEVCGSTEVVPATSKRGRELVG